MLGMQMMLKSLGLDPEEIMKTAEGYGKMIGLVVEQLQRIEDKQDRILLMLDNRQAMQENAPAIEHQPNGEDHGA